MARRSEKPATQTAESTTDEAVTEATVTEPTEAPVEATTETPEVEEKPIDLTPFKDAAQAAVANADESTGEVPQSDIDSVNKVYREIDGVKGKNQARTWVEEQMKASIVEKDILKARAYVAIKDGLSAGGGSAGPKAPADPTVAFVQKVAALRIAQTLVESKVPEGVNDDWTTKVDELLTELSEQVDAYSAYAESTDEDAEAPEVSPVVRQAFKLSAGRATGGGGGTRVAGGPRRDIEKHLIQVFEGREVGTFLTVNEIAKTPSTEYGDDRPSAGAVSARLFPKGDRPAYEANGIKAIAEEGRARGAEKVA